MTATSHKIYLLIDEYDNFSNDVMMARQEHYEALLYGEGLLKTVFKSRESRKSQRSRGIDRVFITGVSSVVLSDMTSGYNVAENYPISAAFNDLLRHLPSPEIAAILATMASSRWFSGLRRTAFGYDEDVL